MRKTILFSLLILANASFAQLNFEPSEALDTQEKFWVNEFFNGFSRMSAFAQLDMDQDEDIDFVASYHDSTLLIFQNDGSGFTDESLIIEMNTNIDFMLSLNINTDEVEDLLAYSAAQHKFFIITDFILFDTSSFVIHDSIMIKEMKLGDFDGDSDHDVFILSEAGDLYWLENLNDGTFATINALQTSATMIESGHLNDDNLIDLVVFDADNNRVSYLLNNGLNAFLPAVEVDSAFDVLAIFTSDINGDGFNDITIIGQHNTIQTNIYYNVTNLSFDDPILMIDPSYFTTNEGPFEYLDYFDSEIFDIDNDGDLEIVVSFQSIDDYRWDHKITYLFQNNGAEFTFDTIGQVGMQFINAVDVDGDGFKDLAGNVMSFQPVLDNSHQDIVGFIKNKEGDLGFGIHHFETVETNQFYEKIAMKRNSHLHYTDLPFYFINIHAFRNEYFLPIQFYNAASQKLNTYFPFTLNKILKNQIGSQSLFSTLGSPQLLDMDGDDDLDWGLHFIQTTGNSQDEVYEGNRWLWLVNNGENEFDGLGGIVYTKPDELGIFFKTVIIDFDGDNDLDLIALMLYPDNSSEFKSRIVWFENVDAGQVLTENILLDNQAPIIDFLLADIDQDGDLDLIANGESLQIFYNQNGNYTSTNIPYSTIPREILLYDLDLDSDLDIIAINDDKITWFKNDAGSIGNETILVDAQSVLNIGPLVEEEGYLNSFMGLISNFPLNANKFLNFADFDGDGDIDLTFVEKTTYEIFVCENAGDLTFEDCALVFSDSARNTQYFNLLDLDDDQDIDFYLSTFKYVFDEEDPTNPSNNIANAIDYWIENISVQITAVSDDVLAIDNGISVFPNPTNSYINIARKSKGFEEYNVLIYNANGQMVKAIYHQTESIVSIPITAEIGKGLYLINIENSKDNVLIGNYKMVVQ